jgi:ubiquinone/menaquinone biosynthesis C-methylase UbiE
MKAFPLRWYDLLLGWRRWGIRKGDRVLEIGSGGNPMIRSNILVDYDISKNAEREATLAHDRPFVQADMTALPFRDHSFDFCYSAHVVEHLADVDCGLKEMTRVAKRGVIILPSEIYERNWCKWSHKWIITLENGTLVFRRKCSCTQITASDMHEKWKTIFWAIYSKNRELLDISYQWNDSIRYRIESCRHEQISMPQPNSPGAVVIRNTFRHRLKRSIKSTLSRIIRSAFS